MGRGGVVVSSVAAALAAELAGCLSGGPPPAGRRITDGRAQGGIAFLSTASVRGLLVARRNTAMPPNDLHLLTLPADDQPPVDRLLAQGVADTPFPPSVDARGRLVLETAFAGQDPTVQFYEWDLELVDPGTDERVDLGPTADYQLSPSGARLVYGGGPPGSRELLREMDGREVSLGTASDKLTVQFVGEDLYYAAISDSRAWRVTPGADPEPIADGVGSIGPVYGSSVVLGPSLYPTTDPMTGAPLPRFSVLDTTTLARTPLPDVSSVLSFSPDGNWLLAVRYEAAYTPPGPPQPPNILLIERATGAVVQDVAPQVFGGQGEWRPGRDELWYPTLNGTVVLTPNQPPVPLDRAAATHYRRNDGANTSFAFDGRLFLSLAPDGAAQGDRTPVELGPVDDPNGRFTRVNPAGSGLGSFWELADGRLLAEDWYKDPQRADLIIIDPATGDSRIVGEAGTGMAVGTHRALARLGIENEIGDLALIDLDTGAHTRLGEAVSSVAVEPRAGADPLAPGTRVAFEVANPTASPYDGVWLVTLP